MTLDLCTFELWQGVGWQWQDTVLWLLRAGIMVWTCSLPTCTMHAAWLLLMCLYSRHVGVAVSVCCMAVVLVHMTGWSVCRQLHI